MAIIENELLTKLDKRVANSSCLITTFADLMEKVGWTEVPQWLSCFDTDELLLFTAEILAEMESRSENDLQTIIHEWHESAIALANPDLRKSFHDSSHEVLLTKPY